MQVNSLNSTTHRIAETTDSNVDAHTMINNWLERNSGEKEKKKAEMPSH